MVIDKASKLFTRPDAGSQGLAKISSEANITGMAGVMASSNHSASAINLAMTTSTPSLTVKSSSADDVTPSVTVTNLVAVITDVRTLVAEVLEFAVMSPRDVDFVQIPSAML